MSVQTGTKAELREALLKSVTEAKAADGVLHLVEGFGVDRFSLGILLLVNELKLAEALLILFRLHKQDTVTWFNVNCQLARQARNHSELSLISTILKSSSKFSLSESSIEIPGLDRFTFTDV